MRAGARAAAADAVKQQKQRAVIEQVTAMGFTQSHAEAGAAAIDVSGENALELCIDWMSSNPDPGSKSAAASAAGSGAAAAVELSSPAAAAPAAPAAAAAAADADSDANSAPAKQKDDAVASAADAKSSAPAAASAPEVEGEVQPAAAAATPAAAAAASGDDASEPGAVGVSAPVLSSAAASSSASGSAPEKPPSLEKSGSGASSITKSDSSQLLSIPASSPLVQQMMDMGFSVTDSRIALERNKSNVAAAISWLLSGGPASSRDNKVGSSSSSGSSSKPRKPADSKSSAAAATTTAAKPKPAPVVVDDPRTLRFGMAIGLQNFATNKYLGVTTVEQVVTPAPGSARKQTISMLGLTAPGSPGAERASFIATTPAPASNPKSRPSPATPPPLSASASAGASPAGLSVSAIAAKAVERTLAGGGGGSGSMSGSPAVASTPMRTVQVSTGGVGATNLSCDKWCRLIIVNPENVKDQSLVLPKQRIALQTVDGAFIAFEPNGDVKALRHEISEGDFNYWTMTDIRFAAGGASAPASASAGSSKPKPLLVPFVVYLESPMGHLLVPESNGTCTCTSGGGAASASAAGAFRPNNSKWRVILHPDQSSSAAAAPSLLSVPSPVRKSSFGFTPPSPTAAGMSGSAADSLPPLHTGSGASGLRHSPPGSTGSAAGLPLTPAASGDEKGGSGGGSSAGGSKWARLRRQFRWVAMRCIALRLDELRESLDRQRKEMERKMAEDRTCVVCLDRAPNTVMLECGHLGVCDGCAAGLKHCALCRGDVTKVVIIKPLPPQQTAS